MKSYLDWSEYKDAGMGDAYADVPRHGGNFAKAVAVCINSGQCEQPRKGVMCPSFRVSEEPHLSPGGRVRLLKQALNQDLTELALSDESLIHALELCLACKGCKRECENNIDMAMIKSEVLAHHFKQNGIPLRTRLLAHLPKLLHRLPGLSTLIRWRNRHRFLARLGELLLGLDAQRSLPVRVSKVRRYLARQRRPSAHYSGEVVLFIDTFSRHYAPRIVDSALTVLDTAGYKVITLDMAAEEQHSGVLGNSQALCCGRTFIAHGLIDQAQEAAVNMLRVLQPHADAGRKIIGLEPACLLAIRDDYRFLGLGDVAERVSSHAILFEEFIAREFKAGRFKLPLSAKNFAEQRVLVHGHCHQKAVGAMKAVRKVLKMIPDLDFEIIEASCCGMAGSFGLEKEHAALSMEMAELDLFPKLREYPDALVVANGFSCRHQIADGLDRRGIHIAELLHRALVDESQVA